MASVRPDFKLIVGLGNPGSEYEQTRHNVGFWLADNICEAIGGGRFSADPKAFGECSRVARGAIDVRLLKPGTFMNRSGQSVAALSNYYKISADQILVLHDELDLSPGTVKIKFAGGHGGHNGLRDISRVMGPNYWRLRIGIGHPGHKDRVSPWVLSRPNREDETAIQSALGRITNVLDDLLQGEFARATQLINTTPAADRPGE